MTEIFAHRYLALAHRPPRGWGRTQSGNIPLTLLADNGWAFLNIRGTGIIDLAEAKQLLALLQDFVEIADDYEHDYAGKQAERLNRGQEQ
tara:strand:- start:14161 stop:14430 length:270 start_codon:yes stop_codon:yes gene_type:complete